MKTIYLALTLAMALAAAVPQAEGSGRGGTSPGRGSAPATAPNGCNPGLDPCNTAQDGTDGAGVVAPAQPAPNTECCGDFADRGPLDRSGRMQPPGGSQQPAGTGTGRTNR